MLSTFYKEPMLLIRTMPVVALDTVVNDREQSVVILT